MDADADKVADNAEEDFSEETFQHELCCGINPDTVVAEGLAIRYASMICVLACMYTCMYSINA